MEAFPHIVQVALFEERPQCAAPQNPETGGRQELLEAFQFPQQEQENPELTEPVPWEDPQTFLASFEQVAKACQWPREEWAAHLLPALSGEAKKSFNELETGDREDYGKVKAAILQGDATNMEARRQRFRQFRYQQAKDPQRIYNQLQELCHLWLKPERHTKEQILELLVLEQFLAILPQEIQNWMKDRGANACFKAMTLVEDFLSSHQGVKEWKSQEIMQEVAASSFAEEEIPSDPPQGQIYKEAKQKGVGDLTLPSGEMATPDCSGSVQRPNGRAVAGGGLAEGAMEVKVVAVAVDKAEKAVLDHTQGPMYWEVLKENYEDVDCSGGVLIPKPDVFPALGQEEIVSIQISDDRETFPGSFSGIGNWKRDGNGNAHQRSPELRKHLETLPGECQDVVPLRPRAVATWPRTLLCQQSQQGSGQGGLHTKGASAITAPQRVKECEGPKGDEETNKSREVLPQQGRNELKEICHTPKTVAKSKVVVIHEEKCKPAEPQDGETHIEFIRLSEGHVSLRETTKHTWVKRLLYSQGGRICPSSQSGPVLQKMSQTGRKLHPCPVCGKTFIQRNILEDHQCVHTGNKLYECPSCGKKFRWRRWVVEHQRIHTGEKPYICSKCGKNFRWRTGLKSHWKIHLRQSSYNFSCRKSN